MMRDGEGKERSAEKERRKKGDKREVQKKMSRKGKERKVQRRESKGKMKGSVTWPRHCRE